MDVGYYPVLAADGSVVGAAVNSRDITAVRRMEEALQRERDLVARITETSPVGIIVLDREGRIAYANSQLERGLGLSREEILGRLFNDPAWPVLDDDGSPLAPERLPFNQLVGDGQTLYDVQHTVVLPDQRKLLLSMNAAPLLDESGRFDGAVMTVQDITARAEAEETMRRYTDRLQVLNEQVQRYAVELEQRVTERTAELEESEARFRTLVEHAAIGIALVDGDGKLLECNPALGLMLRHRPPDLRGKPLAQFVFPPDGEATDLCQELLAGNRDHCQVERRYHRDQGQTGWAHVTGSLIRGSQGEPRFAICMIEDITERKQAQAALLQAERLSLAGRLVASLTHEISNPLQSVIGCLGLAEEALAEGGDLEEYLHIAVEELRRVARIVAQLRNLNRPSMPQERELTDINGLLQEVLTLSERDCARRGVQVTYRATDDLPSIPVAVDRVRQVFLNLVLNAVDAMPEGGQLEVTTSRTQQPDGVRVCFVDTGDGIAPDILPHIFEPFYSTKPEGLGMGLYISRDLVRGHGGHIAAESELGAGSRFTVWLPEREDGDEKGRGSAKE
jgi:PAS domain S-box-containing protein